MSSFRIRPRFKLQVNFSIDQLQNKIENELKKSNQQCNANINNTFITLSLPEKDIQYWSPQLRLALEENEEGKLIRGLYGPKPSVWALFFYFYATFGILGFFAGMYGFVQLSLDMPAPVLWSLPVLAGFSIILYLMSQTGQKIGAQQMFTLHNFFESALNTQVRVS